MHCTQAMSFPHNQSDGNVEADGETNHGAHNKYDARTLPVHHHGIQSGRLSSDQINNATSAPVASGYSPRHQAAISPDSNHTNHHASSVHHSSGHQHADSDNTILHPRYPPNSTTKREKARQKLSSSLKKAKILSGTDARASLSHPYKVPVQIGGVPPERFRVLKVKAVIDKKATNIDERSTAVLKYRTPHFRAMATVEVPPLKENQRVQVGFIQVCTQMRFINTYGPEGITSWEFPEIVSGKYSMIGDADGKQYPWYGSRLELSTIQGPSNTQAVTIHMNDNFFPQVTWYIPHPDYDKTPRLTSIHRKQRFFTFVVIKDLSTLQYHVLKTIEWSMELNIEVHPERPLGKRAQLLPPIEQEQPTVLEHNSVKLEPYALNPPNANNAQTLIWRPIEGAPRIIVPPVETTMDMDRYLLATRGYNFALPAGPR